MSQLMWPSNLLAALTMGELLGIVVLVVDVIAIVDVARSSKKTEAKLLWVIVILLLPLAGPLAYYLLGRGK